MKIQCLIIVLILKEKKISKHSLPCGLNALSAKYPIDERVMDIIKTEFDLDPESIKQKLYENIFDPQTSLYKQIINKFISKKVSNDADMTSKKYTNYINNEKNYFDAEVQKKNIQNSLNKEMDLKDTSKEKKK